MCPIIAERLHPTRLKSGGRVPVVSLEPLFRRHTSPGSNLDLWSLLACHGYPEPQNIEGLGTTLDLAGDDRFLAKSNLFLALLEAGEDPDQVLYESLMESLGYAQNQGPFSELAHKVPYKVITSLAAGWGPENRVAQLTCLLLGASGFGTATSDPVEMFKLMPDTPCPGGRRSPKPKYMVPMDIRRWHLFRVRPQNHPRQRIAGFAELLARFLPMPQPHGTGRQGASVDAWEHLGLTSGVCRLLTTTDQPTEGKPVWQDLEQAFTVSHTDQPACQQASAASPRTLIGAGRARVMVVNVVLPFLHGLARFRNDLTLGLLPVRVYQRVPRLEENEITREMGHQLLLDLGDRASGHPAKPTQHDKAYIKGIVTSARRSQGLHHLHHLITSPKAVLPSKPTQI